MTTGFPGVLTMITQVQRVSTMTTGLTRVLTMNTKEQRVLTMLLGAPRDLDTKQPVQGALRHNGLVDGSQLDRTSCCHQVGFGGQK